jgi:MraZ protein
MFDGYYCSRIDKKNRITIPVKYLRKLGGVGTSMVIIKGAEAYFHLFPFDLNVIKQTFGKIPSCQTVQIKSSGRVQIPKWLKEHAKLKKEIVIAGCNDYIEIWDKKRWGNEKVSEPLHDAAIKGREKKRKA